MTSLLQGVLLITGVCYLLVGETGCKTVGDEEDGAPREQRFPDVQSRLPYGRAGLAALRWAPRRVRASLGQREAAAPAAVSATTAAEPVNARAGGRIRRLRGRITDKTGARPPSARHKSNKRLLLGRRRANKRHRGTAKTTKLPELDVVDPTVEEVKQGSETVSLSSSNADPTVDQPTDAIQNSQLYQTQQSVAASDRYEHGQQHQDTKSGGKGNNDWSPQPRKSVTSWGRTYFDSSKTVNQQAISTASSPLSTSAAVDQQQDVDKIASWDVQQSQDPVDADGVQVTASLTVNSDRSGTAHTQNDTDTKQSRSNSNPQLKYLDKRLVILKTKGKRKEKSASNIQLHVRPLQRPAVLSDSEQPQTEDAPTPASGQDHVVNTASTVDTPYRTDPGNSLDLWQNGTDDSTLATAASRNWPQFASRAAGNGLALNRHGTDDTAPAILKRETALRKRHGYLVTETHGYSTHEQPPTPLHDYQQAGFSQQLAEYMRSHYPPSVIKSFIERTQDFTQLEPLLKHFSQQLSDPGDSTAGSQQSLDLSAVLQLAVAQLGAAFSTSRPPHTVYISPHQQDSGYSSELPVSYSTTPSPVYLPAKHGDDFSSYSVIKESVDQPQWTQSHGVPLGVPVGVSHEVLEPGWNGGESQKTIVEGVISGGEVIEDGGGGGDSYTIVDGGDQYSDQWQQEESYNDQWQQGESYSNNSALWNNVPGVPGQDYPVRTTVPVTEFSCHGKVHGLYADFQARCQVWHNCHANGHDSFLCVAGTLFNPTSRTCDWWYNVDCSYVTYPPY